MTTSSHPNKHADEIPADIEQPSKLIRQDSINQTTSNKRKFGTLIILWATLIIAALGAVYFFLLAPTAASDLPLKPQGAIVAEPEKIPTVSPTQLKVTQVPSVSLTLAPTMSPTEAKAAVLDFLYEGNVSVRAATGNPAVAKAIDWLADEATASKTLLFPFDEKYLQRFGVLIFYYSVFKDQEFELGEVPIPNIGMRTQDECFWRGMKCDENGMLIEIKLSNEQLDGVLPTEWGFFTHLKSIDLSNNGLQGNIPEELYDLTGLEQIFLYKNQFDGTISSKIGKLFDLTHFHVSHNKISGSIPVELGSVRQNIRQLRYFNVHRNQMTGSIPSNMRLRQMFYMDLGNNKFSGNLPTNLGEEYVRLRHLFLDHNNFEGPVPESYINAGNGRIQTLTLNDNNFSGAFPWNHEVFNRMRKFDITLYTCVS
ncbi:MAG: hypothetical protein SGBAC_003997 [Bacillariaceae sp.]